MKRNLTIEGMTCNHCTMHVAKALQGVKGVTAVTVNLAHKLAVVEADPVVTDAELKQAVDDSGYAVSAIAEG